LRLGLGLGLGLQESVLFSRQPVNLTLTLTLVSKLANPNSMDASGKPNPNVGGLMLASRQCATVRGEFVESCKRAFFCPNISGSVRVCCCCCCC